MNDNSYQYRERSQGYCDNCNTNVLHIRCFNSRFTYFLDRLTYHVLAKFGLGPWQCVDCGSRNMRLIEPNVNAQRVCDEHDGFDDSSPVGNFILTSHSLTHAAKDSERFSEKYRMGIVERLLVGKATVSRTCSELNVSELEIQRWIKDYLQMQLNKVSESQQAALIPANFAGVSDDGPLNWNQGNDGVIEVNVGRKPR